MGTIAKYIIAGATASLAMLVSLVFFREVLGIWYLYSSTLAFLVGFTSSFLLQKLWAFKDLTKTNAHKQLVLFFIVSLANLGINALGMFILVDVFEIWYFASQIVVTTSIAIWNFFTYRAIFRWRGKVEVGTDGGGNEVKQG